MEKKIRQLLKRVITLVLTSAMVSAAGVVSLPQLATAVYAADGVKYIDADGTEKTQNGVTEIKAGDNLSTLSGGWYVVSGTVIYDKEIKLTGDVHLILADGATLNIGTPTERVNDPAGIRGNYNDPQSGIKSHNLSIYGQKKGSGALNVFVEKGQYNSYGIMVESLTVNGGHITADSTSASAVYMCNESNQQGDPGLTVNGGELNANATGQDEDAITCCNKSRFTFNGGKVRAKGTGNGEGIDAGGGYYLDYSSPYDEITVSSFQLNKSPANVVNIADGKKLTDEDGNLYSGSVSLTTINDRASGHTDKNTITLRPAFTVSIDGGITNGKVTADKENSLAGDTVNLTVTPDEGCILDSLTVTKAGGGTVETKGSGNTFSFTMPGENVTVTAKMSKKPEEEAITPEKGFTVTLDQTSYKCDGKAKKPKVTVKNDGAVLSSKNYTVKYSGGRKKPGTYKVTVKGKGAYKGKTATAEFTISKGDNPMKVTLKKPSVKAKSLVKKAQTLPVSRLVTVKKNQGKVSYSVTSNTAGITYNAKKKKLTLPKDLPAGIYPVEVTVTAAGNGNYLGGSKTVITVFISTEYRTAFE